MLKQRIITAILLVPAVFAAVLLLPNNYLFAVVSIIMLITAWELARLAGVTASIQQFIYVALVVSGLFFLCVSQREHWIIWFLYVVAGFWSLVFIALVSTRSKIAESNSLQFVTLAVGFLLLLAAGHALLRLHQIAPWLMMFLLLLIWTADTFAYFSGKSFGKNKLSPTVSPGKTWEGVFGALAGGLVCGFALHYLLLPQTSLGLLMALCLLTVMVSVGGDLAESVIKRRANMKDSSNLLPGHGGMFDRIDSLIAAAPFFLVGLMLLGVK